MSSTTLSAPPAVTLAGRHGAGGRHLGPSGLSRLKTKTSELWVAMDNRSPGRRIPGTGLVVAIAFLIQTIAAVFCVSTGVVFQYGDALNHIIISGRITHGFNSGVQQLGTVWLPAPHLITAPFAANHWLWSTGWASAIVGIFAMVASVAALYRICARLGLGRNARLLACLAYLCNPSALYLYTTAMTEPVLFAGLLGSIAGLTHYATAVRPLSGGEIAVYAGIPATIAVLSRYEGWVLLASGVIFILLLEFGRRPRRRNFLMSVSFVFPLIIAIIVLPMLAIGWWGIYNFVNFGDPLEFIYGEFSAFNQQEVLAKEGTLTTQGNIAVTLTVLGGAAWQVVMPVVFILGWIGIVWLITSNGFDLVLIVAGVLFSPFVFNVAALYLGQTTVQDDFSLPTGYFNTRYALTLLPLMAFGVGVLMDKLNTGWVSIHLGKYTPAALTAIIAVAIVMQSIYVLADPTKRSPVIEEGHYQATIMRSAADPIWDYLKENYDNTPVLVDEVTNGVRPQIGIPIDHYYLLASGNHFWEALEQPTEKLGWIIVNANEASFSFHKDAAWEAMTKYPENFASFQLVVESGGYELFRLVS